MSAMGLAYGAPFGRGPGWSPIRLDPLQELRDSTLTDKSGNDLDADYTESSCVSVLDGATLTVTGLIGTETVTNLGTATATPSADTITFTAGTVYGLEIDGEMTYPVIETSGNDTYSVNSTWPDATFSANTWDTQDELHWATYYGFTPASVFDGSDDYVDLTSFLPTTRSNVTLSLRYILDPSKTRGIHFGQTSSGKFCGYYSSGGTANVFLECGSPTISVDGVTQDLDTGELYALISDGLPHDIVYAGVDLSLWSELVVGGYNTSVATFMVQGGIVKVSVDWESTGDCDLCMIPSVGGGMKDIATGDAYPNSGTGDLAYSQIPALTDGTADATGGEITNTKCGYTKIHNGGDYKVLDKSTSTALLDNPSLSADGITFDAKSFDEMREFDSFTDNLIYCSTYNSIIGRWAWTQETVLSDDDKADMLRYIEARGGD